MEYRIADVRDEYMSLVAFDRVVFLKDNIMTLQCDPLGTIEGDFYVTVVGSMVG